MVCCSVRQRPTSIRFGGTGPGIALESNGGFLSIFRAIGFLGISLFSVCYFLYSRGNPTLITASPSQRTIGSSGHPSPEVSEEAGLPKSRVRVRGEDTGELCFVDSENRNVCFLASDGLRQLMADFRKICTQNESYRKRNAKKLLFDPCEQLGTIVNDAIFIERYGEDPSSLDDTAILEGLFWKLAHTARYPSEEASRKRVEAARRYLQLKPEDPKSSFFVLKALEGDEMNTGVPATEEDWKSATQVLEKYATAYGRLPAYYDFEALVRMGNADFFRAKEIAEDFSRQNPNSGSGYFRLAQLAMRENRINEASELILLAGQRERSNERYQLYRQFITPDPIEEAASVTEVSITPRFYQ